MPSITRRRLLGVGVAVAAGTYGAVRLHRGAADAAFTTWTPVAGTWPLRRYDPANTAHNPNARPPRETPAVRERASVTTTAERPRFFPLVSAGHVAIYGSGVAVFRRGDSTAAYEREATTPLAGFGPDGRLHTVRLDPPRVDSPSAVVGYDADERRERYRVPIDADHPRGMALGSRAVYVGGQDGAIRAIDTESGRRWRVDGEMPALGDGRLYAAGTPLDGTVAYAERTGLDRVLEPGPERRWRTGPEPVHGFSHLPAVAGGRVLLGSYRVEGGGVVAFDAATGGRRWGPRSLGADVATPAVAGDRGYTAVGNESHDAGAVVALDLTTGETRWRDDLTWRPFSPRAAGDTLVVAGEIRTGVPQATGTVRAYDAATGDALWTRRFEERVGGLALVEDRVLVTAGSSLYELRP